MGCRSRAAVVFFLGMLVAVSGWAQEKRLPSSPSEAVSPVLLTVKGKQTTNFTLAQLQALPQRHITTTTPWTEGSHTYSGVLLRDLLDRLDLQDVATLNATALNNYFTSLSVADAYQYDVLLALTQDGKLLTRRNKGPIWVVYPLSQHPELDKPSYHSAMIWQLRSVSVGNE